VHDLFDPISFRRSLRRSATDAERQFTDREILLEPERVEAIGHAMDAARRKR
jgi:hypothetical protein